jgi:hypothetical protein
VAITAPFSPKPDKKKRPRLNANAAFQSTVRKVDWLATYAITKATRATRKANAKASIHSCGACLSSARITAAAKKGKLSRPLM